MGMRRSTAGTIQKSQLGLPSIRGALRSYCKRTRLDVANSHWLWKKTLNHLKFPKYPRLSNKYHTELVCFPGFPLTGKPQFLRRYIWENHHEIFPLSRAAGVDVATVAEAFHLDPEVVEEVHRGQAPLWRMFPSVFLAQGGFMKGFSSKRRGLGAFMGRFSLQEVFSLVCWWNLIKMM